MTKHHALLISLADHLEAMARTLREHAASEADADGRELSPLQQPDGKSAGDAVTLHGAAPADPVARARELHPALGSAQAMVIAEVAKAHPRGIKAGEISRALDYDQANTYIVLDALRKHGVVRRDDHARPYLFYLAPGMLT